MFASMVLINALASHYGRSVGIVRHSDKDRVDLTAAAVRQAVRKRRCGSCLCPPHKSARVANPPAAPLALLPGSHPLIHGPMLLISPISSKYFPTFSITYKTTPSIPYMPCVIVKSEVPRRSTLWQSTTAILGRDRKSDCRRSPSP